MESVKIGVIHQVAKITGAYEDCFTYFEGDVCSTEVVCKTKKEALASLGRLLDYAEEYCNNGMNSKWLGRVFVDRDGMYHLVHIGVDTGIPERYMNLMKRTLAEREADKEA